MRGGVLVLAAIAAALAASGASAREIYRCVAANGDVTYTNLACPEATSVKAVATYEPVPDMPAQTWQAAADAAEASAREAREAAERAQAALREQQFAYREPYEAEAPPAPPADIAYVPVWVAPVAYGSRSARRHEHHGDRPGRGDERGYAPRTPLSTIPFHTASPPSPLMYGGRSH
jgi:hypothetical protein